LYLSIFFYTRHAIIASMHELRLKNLQNLLKSKKIEGFLVSSVPNILYLTGVDYFTPEERYAYMFITNRTAYLFTDRRYIEVVKNIVPKGVKTLLHTELFKIIKNSNVKSIGFEQNLTFAEYIRFKKETSLNYYLTDWLIEKLRSVKDSQEIKNIRPACKLTDKTYSHVLKNMRIDITEKEIAWRIDKFIKENGGELSFDTIVAFGANAAIPHHKTSNKKLSKDDQFVLLDFGAKVNGYCSDMTRTLLAKNAKSKAHKIYETVSTAQQKVIDYINTSNGGRLSLRSHDSFEVVRVANKHIVSKGFDPISHGLGHGIGIEIHEEPRLSPKSKDKLVEGNVFTIEPGIYIPGFGGVRIEDDFLLTKNGLEQLTSSPKQIIEV